MKDNFYLHGSNRKRDDDADNVDNSIIINGYDTKHHDIYKDIDESANNYINSLKEQTPKFEENPTNYTLADYISAGGNEHKKPNSQKSDFATTTARNEFQSKTGNGNSEDTDFATATARNESQNEDSQGAYFSTATAENEIQNTQAQNADSPVSTAENESQNEDFSPVNNESQNAGSPGSNNESQASNADFDISAFGNNVQSETPQEIVSSIPEAESEIQIADSHKTVSQIPEAEEKNINSDTVSDYSNEANEQNYVNNNSDGSESDRGQVRSNDNSSGSESDRKQAGSNGNSAGPDDDSASSESDREQAGSNGNSAGPDGNFAGLDDNSTGSDSERMQAGPENDLTQPGPNDNSMQTDSNDNPMQTGSDGNPMQPGPNGNPTQTDSNVSGWQDSAVISHRGKPKRPHAQNFVIMILECAIILLLALTLSALFRIFVAQAFFIPSSSMENTLQIGDRVIATKVDTGTINRGDVIVFHDPDNWLNGSAKTNEPPDDNPVTVAAWRLCQFFGFIGETNDNYLVKRVIGLPGDHVDVSSDNKIRINGVEIDEPYLPAGTDGSQIKFDVTVPEGKYFVLGDNRDNSADSRYNLSDSNGGFVPKSNIAAKAHMIILPLNHFKILDDYSYVYNSVPAKEN